MKSDYLNALKVKFRAKKISQRNKRTRKTIQRENNSQTYERMERKIKSKKKQEINNE